MKTLTWYFDFISPYAYLQSTRLPEFAAHARLECRPVLFAGLLKHFGHKGPAEIEPKRVGTFEHVAWLAHRHGIALAMPPMHPFNPLPLLRLSSVLGSGADVVQRLFRFVWVEGGLPTDAARWTALLAELGTDSAALEAPAAKDAVRASTDAAIDAGIFGVPTSVVDGQRIWGFESTDMVMARLADDPFFDGGAIRAARALPQGVARRT